MTDEWWIETARIFNTNVHEVMPAIKEFWANIDSLEIYKPGVYTYKGVVRYMVAKNCKTSPVQGFQAFPYVLLKDFNIGPKKRCSVSTYQTIIGMLGEVEGMRMYALGIPQNGYRSSFVAFVPVEMLGKSWIWWVRLNNKDIKNLASGKLSASVIRKMRLLVEHIDGVEKC